MNVVNELFTFYSSYFSAKFAMNAFSSRDIGSVSTQRISLMDDDDDDEVDLDELYAAANNEKKYQSWMCTWVRV